MSYTVQRLPGRRTPAVGVSEYFTEFSADENPLSEGGKWLNGLADGLLWKNMKALGGIACAGGTSSTSPPPFDDSVAQLKVSALALPANQYIEALVKRAGGYNPSGTHELGLFVRLTVTANDIRGYEAYLNHSANHAVVRWNGPRNDFTPIAAGNISAPTTPADGDLVRLEISGGTISFYQNGNLRTQIADGNFATGQSGLQSYMEAGGTPESYGYYWIRSGALP